MQRETRAFTVDSLKVEKRDSDGLPHLIGHAAVFGVETDLGYFREKIAPGAFAESIRVDDIRALFNHDANFVLGRNASGTLTMREDARGLAVDVVLPDTTAAADLIVLMKRGDINSMSFGFYTKKDSWDYTDSFSPLRTLEKVKLFDISAVCFPQYPDAECGLRAAGDGEYLRQLVAANRPAHTRRLTAELALEDEVA